MIIKYKLLKDLPLYPKGTILYYEYEDLPSQYINKATGKYDRTYRANEEWYTMDHGYKTMATGFIPDLMTWCINPQREECKDWVEAI